MDLAADSASVGPLKFALAMVNGTLALDVTDVTQKDPAKSLAFRGPLTVAPFNAKQLMREMGIAPPETAPLLEFESPSLVDVIRPLNKHSSNVMTRKLFLTLGQEAFGAPATLGKSVMALRETLLAHNLDFSELFLENGCGLSRNERISAHSMGRLLLAAYRSPHFSELESALPISAIDGTLKKRFNGSAFVGHAHLKTLDFYVQADLEMKRRALETCQSPVDEGLPLYQAEPDLLLWLEHI